MLGWEFPPCISGGLGTACYHLTKAMAKRGINITFVLPTVISNASPNHVNLVSSEGKILTEYMPEFENISFQKIHSPLRPYLDFSARGSQKKKFREMRTWSSNASKEHDIYGWNIHEMVGRYANKVRKLATLQDFDVIHAHDWMTFPAGFAVKVDSGKPLIVHVHSTEFDRSGIHVNKMVYDVERMGMHEADKVIAVSNYTKNIIVKHYGVPAEKVEVVYNGIEMTEDKNNNLILPEKNERIVLFLGRVTMQKGPEYFIAAAKKVLEKIDNVKFIMAGSGDMMYRMIEMAASMGIGDKVLFTKFLHGADVDKAYTMADLYVLPSVSEPFGITPLEALKHNVPVLISKQSGISEVLRHALKVDFWDVDQMANKIIAVLENAPLRTSLRENGHKEALKLRWQDAASRIEQIYGQMLVKV